MHTPCLSAEDAELSSLYVMLAKARLWFSLSIHCNLCQDQAIDPHIMICHRSRPHVLMKDSAMSLANLTSGIPSTVMYHNNNNNQVHYTCCL